LDSFVELVISKIDIQDGQEIEEAMGLLMDYYHAIAFQLLGVPRDGRPFH